jgi:hypothetical protein
LGGVQIICGCVDKDASADEGVLCGCVNEDASADNYGEGNSWEAGGVGLQRTHPFQSENHRIACIACNTPASPNESSADAPNKMPLPMDESSADASTKMPLPINTGKAIRAQLVELGYKNPSLPKRKSQNCVLLLVLNSKEGGL